MKQFTQGRWLALAVVGVLTIVAWGRGQDRAQPLKIGSSGGLGPSTTGPKEKAGMETLRSFIKEETGMENEITRERNWRDLATKMNEGKLQLGVFPGHEFAWAVEENAKLKPLAIAVNVHRYPVGYVVARKDAQINKVGDLQGKTIALSQPSAGLGLVYLEGEAQTAGKKADQYYGQINTAEDAETIIDDVVDSKAQAAVVERSALEAYKRRKPGRFAQLKEVAHSRPFPPTVVAYVDGALDGATLERFRKGLLGANRKERGQSLLTLFRQTGFEAVPDDFKRVVAETGKAYPSPEAGR